MSSKRSLQAAFSVFPRYYTPFLQTSQVQRNHVLHFKRFPTFRSTKQQFFIRPNRINIYTHKNGRARFCMFDKVPKKLPDWWDDEDEDEDEDDEDDEDEDEENNDTAAFKNDPGFEAGGGGGPGDSGHGSSGGGGSGSSGRSSGDQFNEGGDHSSSNGLFQTAIAAYVASVQKYPVRTKAVSTCILAVLGDLAAQKISQDSSHFEFDKRRSLSIAIWGLCFMGPVLHMWYGALDRLFPSGKLVAVRKMLVDQIFFAPFFNGAFIAGIGVLEGNKVRDVSENVQKKLWPSMKANWTLWPAAQMINFALIPKTFQIIYVNGVALIWNVILTYISHEDASQQEMQPAENK